VPDAYYGEQVMAWIKTKEGVSLTEADVRNFCHGQIMEYKIPHYVKFVTEFPTTVTGKVQKYRMREISTAELGLSSGTKKVE
jgi:fatty-acyl-CoA synthase